MKAVEEGRGALSEWLAAQPKNFYDADSLLRILVERAGLGDRIGALEAFGAVAAGPLDAAAIENNRPGNLPVLDSHDGIGRYVARIMHHPSYHRAGKLIYGSGVMAAYAEIPNPHPFILSLFYLSAHVGEGGHNCPLACTAGAIRALQTLGTDEQKAAWLPRLLTPVYGDHYAGAQFLTEVQGGSDVGANAVVAERQTDGSWHIAGEKWFCSSADADVFVVTARPEGAAGGTKGLGLFLVPREVGGEPNGFVLRRLKDKLGTRSMVTAEIDFEGARAEQLGSLEHGFRNTMELIIDTSRLYNAFGCAAMAHRAYLVARGYAEHRRAFGETIGRFPLVKETLSMIRADAEAALAGSFWLAQIQQRVDGGEASDDEAAFLRMGLNLNKVRTASLSHDAVNRGIEILGGNGTIETFSVLPRLLRDNVVFENWEGTHHTLRMQVLNDALRLGLHEGFFAMLEKRLGSERLRSDRQAFDLCLKEQDTLLLRRVCDHLGSWIHLAALEDIDEPGIRARAELTTLRHLSEDPSRDGYGDLIERCAS
ncbi:MAG: acyl-CoA dehydrogenase family protein [Acidimicrobiia bacterium]|nr:acyl-CoA dehydrogenase family protein [Acidimicrobiia bacterium]MDH3397739.1 acyl-CoA dehydrogenase family protein [Acidimicrobiia bacterium]